MTAVYIVSRAKGSKTEYIVRSRLSLEEARNDLEDGDSLGYSLFRMFRDVPTQCIGDVLEACSEFRIGKLTSETLDEKVKGILDRGEK